MHTIPDRHAPERKLAGILQALAAGDSSPAFFFHAPLYIVMPTQPAIRRRHLAGPVGAMRNALSGLYFLLLAAVAAGCGDSRPAAEIAHASAERGKSLIQRYGCAACHAIPGIDHYGSNVGPPLHKMAVRGYVGGVLPNTPDNLMRWLMNPPGVDPLTAMPALGISETEAGDIAAYLYTLK